MTSGTGGTPSSGRGPAARPLRVAVVGEQQASPTARELAYQVGRELARRGAVVLTGGLGGVMEAASRGCHEAGGLCVGILPGEDPGEANDWVHLPIVTGMGHARNVVLVRSADGVIAVGGSYGTLSEIALALKLGRPVVGLFTWELVRPGAAPGEDPILRARDAAEAVELLWARLAPAPSALTAPTGSAGAAAPPPPSPSTGRTPTPCGCGSSSPR